MADPVFTAKNLHKSFGAAPAFRLGPLSFDLYAGETVALIGANGAGKSTLFQLMTAFLDPDEGEISFLGEVFRPEHADRRKKMGYLPQNLDLPRFASAQELTRYAFMLHPELKGSVEKTLQLWDAASYQNKPMAALSYGMQKRVGLCLASFHNPLLMILDEPFSGLDILHVRTLETLLETRRAAGLTTLLSTHNIHQAAELSDRALVMKNGRLKELSAWNKAAAKARVHMIEDEFFG